MQPQSQTIVIRNGRVIDPSQRLDAISDVVVIDGLIASIESLGTNQPPNSLSPRVGLNSEKARVIDATNKVVAPGFIDLHTHLRTPGQEWKEDPKTASDAAVRGGFTTICAMPNTYPAQDNASVVDALMQRCADESDARVRPIGAITKERKGQELAPMHELADAGVIGFSDDGDPVMSPHIMRQALAYSSDLNLPIINHAEDRDLVSEWDMNEGAVATHLGLRGIPNSAESMMIARDIVLASITNGRLHIPHVSTAESVEIVRRAKADSIRVTAETTPHHLALTEEWVYGECGNVPATLTPYAYNTNAKMAPPLRTETDRQALIEGLNDGTIDAIATDHAPHADTDKICTFTEAANGIIGLETAISLTVGMAKIDIKTVIERLTVGPRAILNDNSVGTLQPGARADITIIDPNAEWEVNRSTLGSKSHNTPLLESNVKPRIVATFVSGVTVWDATENGAPNA